MTDQKIVLAFFVLVKLSGKRERRVIVDINIRVNPEFEIKFIFRVQSMIYLLCRVVDFF